MRVTTYLALAGLVAWTLCAQSNKFVFKKLSNFASTATVAHVRLSVNLTSTLEYVASNKKYVRKIERKTFTLIQNANKETTIISDDVYDAMRYQVNELQDYLGHAEKEVIRTVDMTSSAIVDTRNKRSPQMGAFALGALGTMGMSMILNAFSSGYSNEEINQIRDHINKNTRQTDLIVKSVDILSTQLHSQDVDMKRFRKQVAAMEKQDFIRDTKGALNLFRYMLYQIFQKCKIDLTSYIHGIKSLLENKITTQLVSFEQVRNILDQVEHDAEKKNLQLVFSDVISFYSYEFTLVHMEKGLLELYVHVPLSRSPMYSLYEFQRIPIQLPQGTIISPKPDSELIIVDPSSNIFAPIHQKDLDKCQIHKKTIFCPKMISYRKDWESYCVSSLFMNDKEAIQKTCTFQEHRDSHEMVVVGDDHSLLIFAPEKTVFHLTCPQNESSTVIQGYRQIYLKDSCTLSSKYTFTAKEAKISMKKPLYLTYLHYSVHDLLNGTNDLAQNFHILDSQVQSHKVDLAKLNATLADLKAESNRTEPLHMRAAPYHMIGTSVLLLVIVAFMIGLAVLMIKAKRAAKK